MKKKAIAIYGAGGFGREVAVLLEQINAVTGEWENIGFFDDGKPIGSKINDYPILGGFGDLNSWQKRLHVVFALGNRSKCMELVNKIDNRNIRFATLIHPSAILSSSRYVSIGEGSIICAGSIITTNVKIGRHVFLNLACTVGHDTIIGDFSAFMPGCNISGEVSIGDCTYWGTGAKIINCCKVGDRTIIGAGTVVIHDIPVGVTAVGVPARIVGK
jgi:sugar O-acyltransferase (sialic acid O-acetyltransferase NeuD family)